VLISITPFLTNITIEIYQKCFCLNSLLNNSGSKTNATNPKRIMFDINGIRINRLDRHPFAFLAACRKIIYQDHCKKETIIRINFSQS